MLIHMEPKKAMFIWWESSNDLNIAKIYFYYFQIFDSLDSELIQLYQ